MKITTKFLNSKMRVPEYATAGSAGFDLQANIHASVQLESGERILIPTGICMAISLGFEVQVRPRSGMALKYGITVLNSPGTIDSDYRGDVGVILYNTSKDPFIIMPGDRVAQAVYSVSQRAEFGVVYSLDETERGGAGFGSTGK